MVKVLWVTALMFAGIWLVVGLLAFVNVVLVSAIHNPFGVVAAWLFVVAPLVWYVYRWRRKAIRRAEDTRALVREAEQGFEDALRGSAGPVQAPVVSIRGEQTRHHGLEAQSERRLQEARTDAQARLTLSELWAVTHRRLDHYHGIALGQAQQSFRNAQITMALGFALLIGFIVVALNASTTAGTVVAGGLGAVSAALAGYVSRTFIRSQEAAAGHLRAYFDQPLEFSRYLAAERLMADAGLSEEKRAEILSLLVQTMIARPADLPSAGTTQQPPGNTS